MIVSFQTTREKIGINISETDQEWLAVASLTASGDVTGFVRFCKSEGYVEISNFNAHLPRCALDMGVSTKATDNKQAGTHGEGFKVGALVMLRKRHQVRYEASNFYWNFVFGGAKKNVLYCHLTPATSDEIQVTSSTKRTTKSRLWTDVTVKIGRVLTKGAKKVECSEFSTWTKVFLPFEQPRSLIRTSQGDLILDKRLAGHIYLKGLYLGESASKSARYGYNFYEGNINRDRHKLNKPKEEAQAIAAIWGESIKQQQDVVLPKYCELLTHRNKNVVDTQHVAEFMTFETAQLAFESIENKQLAFKQAETKQHFYYNRNDSASVSPFLCSIHLTDMTRLYVSSKTVLK